MYFLLIFLLLVGCGDSKQKAEVRSIVEGFDIYGEKVTCLGLKLNEACTQPATEESDACLNEGFEVRYCQDCTILCSGSTAD